jgi:hypothetical protein
VKERTGQLSCEDNNRDDFITMGLIPMSFLPAKLTGTTVKASVVIIAAALQLLTNRRAFCGELPADPSAGIAPNAFAPVAKGTGFAMDGYFVWCGSVIKVGDMYEMFVPGRLPATLGDRARPSVKARRALCLQGSGHRETRRGQMGQRDGT